MKNYLTPVLSMKIKAFIIILSIFLIAKIFLIALKDPSQWRGFYISAAHILILACSSLYILRQAK